MRSGIPGHLDVDIAGCQAASAFRQVGGGAHRHSRLADDDGGSAQPRHELVDNGVHVAQIGGVFTFFLRGADAEEVHVSEIGRFVVVGGEVQPARGEVVAQHLSQARLVKRDIAGCELGDLTGVDVDAEHVVSKFSHTDGMRRAEIASAEYGASHTASIGSRGELTAKRH
jgi:hypothetical protein